MAAVAEKVVVALKAAARVAAAKAQARAAAFVAEMAQAKPEIRLVKAEEIILPLDNPNREIRIRSAGVARRDSRFFMFYAEQNPN